MNKVGGTSVPPFFLGSTAGKRSSAKSPNGFFWGGRRELNPQPSEPQSDALPIELLPPQRTIIAIATGLGLNHYSDYRHSTTVVLRPCTGTPWRADATSRADSSCQ